MAILHVHQKVQNYKTWRAVFDELGSLRQKFGCSSETVMVNAKDENEVVVILVFDSLDSAQQYGRSPELGKAMERAGVIPPPQITMMEER